MYLKSTPIQHTTGYKVENYKHNWAAAWFQKQMTSY
jgi:hypothetical protein